MMPVTSRGCRRALVLLAVIAGSGCGATATYRPAASPGEIVWSYDGTLQAVKDGQVVASGATWSKLPNAVRCVPRAQELAREAKSSGTTAQVLLWTGLAVIAAGAGGGAALLATQDNAWTGLGVLTGGLSVGAGLSAGGVRLEPKAVVKATDAVNVYNDYYSASGSCGDGPAAASASPSP
jgi:hypothetical protein